MEKIGVKLQIINAEQKIAKLKEILGMMSKLFRQEQSFGTLEMNSFQKENVLFNIFFVCLIFTKHFLTRRWLALQTHVRIALILRYTYILVS